MSARAIRRHFAAPLVITIATACSAPIHRNPPPPEAPPEAQAPPETPREPPPATPIPHPENPPAPAEPPPERPVATYTNPPPPASDDTPAPAYATVWNINYYDGACHAGRRTSCPKGARCNPPPPVEYACPAGMGETLPNGTVVREAGSNDCFVNAECPKGARCAPKTKVPCPAR